MWNRITATQSMLAAHFAGLIDEQANGTETEPVQNPKVPG
jgi:hypothetical protein